jgi:hypothetical protein
MSPVLEMKKVTFSRLGVAFLEAVVPAAAVGEADTGRTIDPGTMHILHSLARA